MSRRFSLLPTSLFAVLLLCGSTLAIDYHIGSGSPNDTTHFATLEEFRIALAVGQGADPYHLKSGDNLILYKNDSSLTKELGTAPGAKVTVRSNDPNQLRDITILSPNVSRVFNMNYPSSNGSALTFEGIGTISGATSDYSSGGAIYGWWHNDIYARGVTFENNKSLGGGGVMYLWDTYNVDLTDAVFKDNTATGAGGAIYINASGTMTGNTTNITLGASGDGKVSKFSGNRHHTDSAGVGGTANSIDFTGSSGKTTNLYIKTEGTGILDMEDPFSTSGSGYWVNITKTGIGTWKLGGTSRVAGSLGTKISIQEGLLELYQGAQLNAAGSNDEFNVSAGANVWISGDNTLTGTRVLFAPGSNLLFDMSYYNTHGEDSPMLYLSGQTLTIQGIRIDAKNLAPGSAGYGDYTLIRGEAALDAGNFELWIGSMNVDVSGRISSRFGYSLNNNKDPKELVLSVNKTANSALTWKNHTGDSTWNFTSKNWDEPDYSPNGIDSFVPGDSVIFDLAGTNIITLSETMSISKDNRTDGKQTNEMGMRVSGTGNWTFRGEAITDEYTYDPNMIASLLFDGSGSLALYNSKANTFHGNLTIAGGGIVNFINANQLGLGEIVFQNNVNNRLTGGLSTTLTQHVLVESGGRGTLDSISGTKLTVTRAAAAQQEAVTIRNGGTLNTTTNVQFYRNDLSQGANTHGAAIVADGVLNADYTTFLENKAVSGGAIYVSNTGTANLNGTAMKKNAANNNGGAVYVNGGTLKTTSTDTLFEENTAGASGGAVYVQAGTTNFKDATFKNNTATTSGGAIFYQGATGSTMTLGASTGKTSLYQGNIAAGVRNAIGLGAAANGTVAVNVETDGTGVLDIRDGMNAVAGTYSANVTKTGTGTWKLAGNSVFDASASTIDIKAGTFMLAKKDDATTTTAGSLTLNNNGTLTVAAGATLAAQGTNTITVGTLNLANGATLGFDLEDYNSGNTPALLNVTATSWNINNWTQNIDLLTLGKDDEGTYNLMTVNGRALNIANMTLMYRGEEMSALRARTGALQQNGQTLQVYVNKKQTENGETIWTNGASDSTWNGTSLDWDGQGVLSDTKQFLNGDAVKFGDTGSGTVTVNAGGVEIAAQGTNPGMVVSNGAGHDYVFTGGSIVAASGKQAGLYKEGAGSVRFQQDVNGFNDTITIRGGTVIAESVKSLGTGDIDTGLAADGTGTVQFDLAADKSGTFSQRIYGDGNLLKTGAGDLLLTNAANDYVDTVIRGGRIIAETVGTGKIDTGIDETQKGTMVFNTTVNDITHSGLVSGTGSVEKLGDKTLTLTNQNTYEGGTTIGGGRLVATNVQALGTGNVVNNGELEFALSTGTDGRFDASISGTGSLIKSGTDSLTLSASNTFSGATMLEAGRLILVNSTALQNSTLHVDGAGSVDFTDLTSVVLGGLAGTEGVSLTNVDGQSIALTLGGNNQNAEYYGNLGGTGSVTKIGTGTQLLGGNNTFDGGLIVTQGRLVADGVAALGKGTIKTNAELEVRVAASESQSLDRPVTGTGSFEKSGDGTLTLLQANKNTGETLVSAGTLNVASLDYLSSGPVRVALQGTLSFAVDRDQELASNISSSGTLTKTGAGNLFISETPPLTGTMNILQGGLTVNGTSGAATVLESGTFLAGSGKINNTVTLKSGAAQYVGNINATSQNMLTARDFQYDAGSTIYVKVGQYGCDRIIAENGFDFAKAGGTVNVVLISLGDFNDSFTDGKSSSTVGVNYDIFTALQGGMTLNGITVGEQESMSSILQLGGGEIRFSVGDGELSILGHYVKKDGYARILGLDLLSTGNGSYTYLTENQKAVFAAAGSADVFNTFFRMGQEFRGDMLNELMPMIQTIMPYISQRAVTQTNLATFERLRFLREPLALGVPEQNAAYRGSSFSLAKRNGMHNALWFQNFGDFLRTYSDGDSPGFDVDAYGFTVGYDRYVNACSIVGVGLGGFFANANTSDTLQKARSRSFIIDVYGSRRFSDNWTILGAAGMTFSRYDIDRFMPTYHTSVNSGHNGTSVFASAELTKRILFGGLEVSPYLGADWIWLCEEDYRERGDLTKALYVDEQDTTSFLTTLGFRLGRSFRMMERNIVNPSIYMGWVHDWGDGRIKTSAMFPNQPMFVTRGSTMYNDRGICGVNLNMTVNERTDFFARFNAELARRYSDLSLHWGMRVAF